MTDPRTQIVADGYDAIGETFAAWREEAVGDPCREWEDELVARLDEGARVLELGCGGGSPETRRLAQRFAVTGVDISPHQVERARAAIPEATFVCADFTDLDLPAGSFGAADPARVSRARRGPSRRPNGNDRRPDRASPA